VDIAENASGEIHVILTVGDDGDPRLVSYRRMIVEVQK
jgi:hypothetical protein